MTSTQFETFLKEEVSKVQGIAYPVKASFLTQALVKQVPLSRLHPNPDDEFCSPAVGPNYEIISRYAKDVIMCRKDWKSARFTDSDIRHPLEVQKIYPDGYMILNGHHRWGAAHQVGVSRLPIRINNLTQKEDIQRMLQFSAFEQRVSLDLDEVVLRPEDDPLLEKPLRFPMNRIYRERLRLGIPALFYTLKFLGYDIWVYTAKYYSPDYLRYYFKHYGVRVTGIITGLARKTSGAAAFRKEAEKLLNSRYRSTVHISNDAVTRTFVGSRSFEEYPLNGSPETWSRDVIAILEKLKY